MVVRLQFSRGRIFALEILLGAIQAFVSNQALAQATTPPGTIARTAPVALPVDPAHDIVCEQLMADYILRGGKIQGDTVDAAIVIIASRAERGYWRTVFKHFQESQDNNLQAFSPSPNLLRILTKMLWRDGRARWLLSHPEELKQSAWAPSIVLPAEVIDTIIARAKIANRQQFDNYVVAIMAAHDARSKPFLLDVLNDKLPPVNGQPVVTPSAQFHAAVGLANLGERAGVEWLVNTPGSADVGYVPHIRVPGGNLHEARLRALSDLTGQPYQPLEKWQAWWKTSPLPDPFEPKSAVQLRYP
jgi:hypothetical protein